MSEQLERPRYRPSDSQRRRINLSKLPERVYARHPGTGRVCMIVRGRMGFVPVHNHGIDPATLNAGLQPVPTAQEVAAMETGCLFGWEAEGADPDHPAHAVPCTAVPDGGL